MSDESDPTISFNDRGECNYCTKALGDVGRVYFPGPKGTERLQRMLETVKAEGKGKKYDCIMGLSGGLDSSYLAYLGHQWGLRVLAIHIDDGFDTEISKNNLSALVKATGFDYLVIKPDPFQFNELTKAFLRAGVPNIAMPQDNVLFAFLYENVRKYGIKYFLSGGNFALESILQQGNTHKAYDVVNIKAINRRFGQAPIDKLKFISTIRATVDKRLLGIESLRPLNYIDYNRDRAFSELHDYCGFMYYGRKHLENSLTEFAQLYWFPKKFGVDKRTSHLSSMIVSGQLTREQAMLELSKPLYQEDEMQRCITLIKERLKISDDEFEDMMTSPAHQHTDYLTEDDRIYFKLFKALVASKKVFTKKA